MNIEKIKKDSLKYISESKNYIYITAVLFVIFAVLGFVFSSHLGFIDEILKELIKEVSLLEGTDISLYIFANNVQSAIIGLFSGIFLGIMPIVNIVTNGVVIGYVLSKVSANGSLLDMWRILPHGIFEIPAIFIALGMGIKLGMSFFTKYPFKTFRERLYLSAIVFLTIVLPLLAIAAIIEGFLIALAD